MQSVTPRLVAEASEDLPGSDPGAQAAPGSVVQRDTLLARIVRRRRKPLLLVIDCDGELVFSSVPESAPASEQRLLGQALAEARGLFQSQGTLEFGDEDRTRSVIACEGQRSVLVSLDNEFFSLRVVRLHGVDDECEPEQFAALVEPIVEPLGNHVDFERVRQKYRLSNREGQVLQALMTGAKDKEIAQRTGLTTGTVRSYLKSIRAKLGVTTRTAIVNVVHRQASDGPSTGR